MMAFKIQRGCVWFCLLADVLVSVGCAPAVVNKNPTAERIQEELKLVMQLPKPEQPDAVGKALLPPLKIDMPKGGARVLEPRFDLIVSNASAAQVFMGIVSGTRYSMLVPPDVSGSVSINLKDVTVLEALDAIRDLNGYEYKLDGNRILIQSPTMQTRVFRVNYLSGTRAGSTRLNVTGGSTGSTGSSSSGGSSGGGSASVATTTNSDFWKDLTTSLNAIVGSKDGRSVIVSPQSGVIVVRALPSELRGVADFLVTSQLSVERQVILEAKILEVELSDNYQTGINWAAFRSSPSRTSPTTALSIGSPNEAGLAPLSASGAASLLTGAISGTPGSTLTGAAGMFGLVFQTGSFAALLSFLESQGTLHVLSSPRIATMNNQKAILKVGSDDFFVTSATSTTTTGTATTTTPSVSLQQFFSGIVLDVTPQIDDKGNIILHIHPSVTRVSETNKTINLGSAGSLTLPLASTTVSETDSIVRARDGQIVAIGGLMRQSSTDDRSQMPGLGNSPVGALFKQSSRVTTKRELVILLKPTIVLDSTGWAQDVLEAQQRIQSMTVQ